MSKTRIFFIGGGNMAEAIFARICPNKYQINVIQRNKAKCDNLIQLYPHITFCTALDEQLSDSDILILAVKPIDAKNAILAIQDKITFPIIISVMAGITTNILKVWSLNNKIIRIMPNTPSSVGEGLSGIYFNENITDYEQQQIKAIFISIGKIFICQNEEMIDKITAVAGSAPAYFFYFLESMIDVAINQFGLSKEDAQAITLQVAKGSIKLIENNQNLTIAKLRTNVTSKNGTTERAINVFEQYDLKQIVHKAEVACYNRAKEISQSFNETL